MTTDEERLKVREIMALERIATVLEKIAKLQEQRPAKSPKRPKKES